ncbi:protein L [Salmonella enterica subsp. enterica serovar Montevideo]|nr:protein L [Salmonella enterica subsp. enterica serovar Montevideo]
MALYKNSQQVKHSTHSAFDTQHNPGVAAPYAGIYRCINCGHEIGIAEGHTLPPQHQNHPNTLPIKWQMVVFAEHK